MIKDNLSVRVYNIEQSKPLQAFVRNRDVVLFAPAIGGLALNALLTFVTAAKNVNYLRPVKNTWSQRRIENGLVAEAEKLGEGKGKVLCPRVLDKDTFAKVSTLIDMLPSYQIAPTFDMTPAGGAGVILCRMPYSATPADRPEETQREISRAINLWESLNESESAETRRHLILLFV